MEPIIEPPSGISDRGLSYEIIGAAIEVHRIVGPRLLESAYSECLAHELELRGLPFVREKTIPIVYKGHRIEHAYRADFVVAERIVVEIKAVDALADVHVAQTLTYLRWSGLRIGLLFNFHAYSLRQGMKRIVL